MTKQLLSLCVMAAMLTGCSTVKLPMAKLAEFGEAAKKLNQDFPDVADAPAAPLDMPSAAEFDASAKRLMAVRDGLITPDDSGAAKTKAEFDAEYERRRAYVNAYKADDPQ